MGVTQVVALFWQLPAGATFKCDVGENGRIV